jgi:hypothetical protein
MLISLSKRTKFLSKVHQSIEIIPAQDCEHHHPVWILQLPEDAPVQLSAFHLDFDTDAKTK